MKYLSAAEPTTPVDAGAPKKPGPLKNVELPAAGIKLRLPSAWTRLDGPPEGPLVATLTSGRATIAIWRYPRVERLPRTNRDLRAQVAAGRFRAQPFVSAANLSFQVPDKNRRRGLKPPGPLPSGATTMFPCAD